jgi:hypothetical protein
MDIEAHFLKGYSATLLFAAPNEYFTIYE